MASKILPGYPQSIGAKRESIAIHFGPSSYTVISTGSPPTGGDTLHASEFGLKYFEDVRGGLSDDGQYEVLVTFADKSTPPKTPSSVILQWVVSATGAEVTGTTNLSARAVRLRAVGHGG